MRVSKAKEPPKPLCPSCGGAHVSKAGRRKGTRLFICVDCGGRFTENTGTIFENSRNSRDVWEKVAAGLIAGEGVDAIRKRLGKGIAGWTTAWSMRANLMHAVGGVAGRKLTGVVEFGLLYLRDGEKGAHRRDGEVGDLGVCGPGFRVCALGVDRNGTCAARMMRGGAWLADDLEAFVSDVTDGVDVACTNANGAYARALKRLGIMHYIEPSYADAYGEDSRESLAELQSYGLAPRIEGNWPISVPEFMEMREGKGLGLKHVEELKAEVRQRIVTATAGVEGAFYGLYAGWAEYAHNLEVELGRALDEADAKRVVDDAVGARTRLSTADVDAMRRASNDVGGEAYVEELRRRTDAMRPLLRNDSFTFGEESGAEAVGAHEVMACVPEGVLREHAKRQGIDVTWMSRPGVEDALAESVEADPAALLWYAASAARMGARNRKGRRR